MSTSDALYYEALLVNYTYKLEYAEDEDSCLFCVLMLCICVRSPWVTLGDGDRSH